MAALEPLSIYSNNSVQNYFITEFVDLLLATVIFTSCILNVFNHICNTAIKVIIYLVNNFQ